MDTPFFLDALRKFDDIISYYPLLANSPGVNFVEGPAIFPDMLGNSLA